MESRFISRNPTILERFDTPLNPPTTVNLDDPLFQPFPPEIVFKGYTPYENYEMTLTMRNNDRVARTITVLPPNSTIFSIIPKSPADKKIAAGMETTFQVRFSPDADRDFQYDLVCVTEREKFMVPIRTIGSRRKWNCFRH